MANSLDRNPGNTITSKYIDFTQCRQWCIQFHSDL